LYRNSIWDQVLALLGLSDLETVKEALALNDSLPLIGSTVASMDLRVPFNKVIVNIRASVNDEMAGALDYFITNKGLSSIGIFYESGTQGQEVRDALSRALYLRGLSIAVELTEQSDLTVPPNPIPQVMLIYNPLGTYLAQFMAGVTYETNFCILSAADPDWILSEIQQMLASRGIGGKRFFAGVGPTHSTRQSSAGLPLYFTQVMPNPTIPFTNLTTLTDAPAFSELVWEYQQAMASLGMPLSYLSFEGYLTGAFIQQVISNINGQVTRERLLSVIYASSFQVGGLDSSSFYDRCVTATDCSNQGMKQVFLAAPTGNASNPWNSFHTYSFTSPETFTIPSSTGSSSNNDSLIIGLVVGLVGGFFLILLLLAAAFFFGAYYWVEKTKKENMMHLMNETPLAMLEASLVQLELEEQEKHPFDLEASMAYENGDPEFGLQLSKTSLDFGLDVHDQCPVNELLVDTIIFENVGKHTLEYYIHQPLRNHKYSILFTPITAKIKPKQKLEVRVEMIFKVTTVLDEEIHVEVLEKGHTVIALKRESELSTFLDYEEITISGKPIGVGGFGKVFKGKWRGARVAVKVMKDQNPQPREMEAFQKEIELVTKLRHKNIVNFIGAVVTPGKMCMVSEFIELGSLQGLIDKQKKMSKLLRAKIALDIANGMNFLHKSGILHRDLKPDNVLMVSLSLKADINAKLSDFGTSRAVGGMDETQDNEEERNNFTKGLGTPIYMAPEILQHKDYSEKADVYSFAVMLWTLIAGKEPYTDFKFSWDIARFVNAGKRLEIPKGAGGMMTNLITKAWSPEPSERYSFEEIVQMLHSYVMVKQYGIQDQEEEEEQAIFEDDDDGKRRTRSTKRLSSNMSSRNTTGKTSRNTTRNTSKNTTGGKRSESTNSHEGTSSRNASTSNYGKEKEEEVDNEERKTSKSKSKQKEKEKEEQEDKEERKTSKSKSKSKNKD
jgi:serine/threonine protein kinase